MLTAFLHAKGGMWSKPIPSISADFTVGKICFTGRCDKRALGDKKAGNYSYNFHE